MVPHELTKKGNRAKVRQSWLIPLGAHVLAMLRRRHSAGREMPARPVAVGRKRNCPCGSIKSPVFPTDNLDEVDDDLPVRTLCRSEWRAPEPAQSTGASIAVIRSGRRMSWPIIPASAASGSDSPAAVAAEQRRQRVGPGHVLPFDLAGVTRRGAPGTGKGRIAYDLVARVT